MKLDATTLSRAKTLAMLSSISAIVNTVKKTTSEYYYESSFYPAAPLKGPWGLLRPTDDISRTYPLEFIEQFNYGDGISFS